ncbi:DUF4150 domain-containing protein [Azohydromonas aeria]|uniref:DUF4150 domain-containing protein n=1 Tax=Azohydromonas aeria TaxID=2590212 RepID=UPI00287330A2|nr:DUF4150 domain-containing protein [Azohydromonas aeria]
MANQVYANSMEISCKAGAGKSICAFPDVCFTPPQTPATPPGVPVPYPNTGFSSDCSDGSTTVKIAGQEVMLKDKSYFKRSTGDEAGCAPKKNVITSKITGKVYFNAWSMDVKFEGENVVRHLDLTTHNHASKPGATPPVPEQEEMAAGLPKMPLDCENKTRSNDEPWSKCDYQQYCSKIAKINRQARNKNNKLNKAYKNKRSAKKLKRQKRNAQRRHRVRCEREFNNGTKSQQQIKRQFAHPCAYREWKKKGSLDDFQPDHTREVQLGGHPSSPSNFKWMTSHVNASLGATLQSYDPEKYCGVKATCCPA